MKQPKPAKKQIWKENDTRSIRFVEVIGKDGDGNIKIITVKKVGNKYVPVNGRSFTLAKASRFDGKSHNYSFVEKNKSTNTIFFKNGSKVVFKSINLV